MTTWQAWHLRFSELPAMVPERSSYLTCSFNGYESLVMARFAILRIRPGTVLGARRITLSDRSIRLRRPILRAN